MPYVPAVIDPQVLLIDWLLMLPLFAAAAALVFPRLKLQVHSEQEAAAMKRGPYHLGALTCLMGISLALRLLWATQDVGRVGVDHWWSRDLYQIRLEADAVTSVFVVAIYGIGLLVFVHAGALPSADRAHHRSGLLLAAQAAAVAAVLSTDVVLLVFALQAMVVCFWLLASLDSPRGGDLLLISGGAGGVGLLLGAILMWQQGGDTSLAQLPLLLVPASPKALTGISVLVLAGLLPLLPGVPAHGWLPTLTHKGSSAVLAATCLLVLVAGNVLSRLLPGALIIATVGGLAGLSLVVGLATLWWGLLRVHLAVDLRGRAAWLTVAQSGHLLVALAGASSLTPQREFLQAMAVHTIAAPLALLAVWLAVGAVRARTGNDALTGLSGLLGRMPSAALGLLVGGLSLAGVPPLPGFREQSNLISGWLAGGHWVVGTAVALADLAMALLVLGTFRRVFLPRGPAPYSQPGRLGLAAPVLIVSVLLLAAGVWSGSLVRWEDLMASTFLSLSPTP